MDEAIFIGVAIKNGKEGVRVFCCRAFEARRGCDRAQRLSSRRQLEQWFERWTICAELELEHG